MMGKREAVKAILEGKGADRIPVIMNAFSLPVMQYGYNMFEVMTNPEKMTECMVGSRRRLGYDGMCAGAYGVSGVIAGHLPNSEGVVVGDGEDTIRCEEDLAKLKSYNPDEDFMMQSLLKTIELMRKEEPDEPIYVIVSHPTGEAFTLLGAKPAFKSMIKKPDKVLQLLEVIVENNNRYIQRLLNMGIGIGFADPVSSTSILRVKQYEKFSLPFLQKNVDFIKKQGGGCGLHICGESREIWEDLIQTGIGCFGPDNVESMKEAKEVLGPHMAIQGNVPPIEVLRMGTPQDVLRASRKCIREAYDSPCGYTLTSGCQTPMGTPEENLQALMDAARIFGRYPVDEELLWM